MRKNYQSLAKKISKNAKSNESLGKHTTFDVGGKTDIFLEAKSKNEIISAIKQANKFDVPFVILGGGSNVVVSDKGFRGLVIKNNYDKIETVETSKKVTLRIGSGALLQRLVSTTVKKGFGDLTFLAGIPGTVGGAVFGNAGTPSKNPEFDHKIGDFVERVALIDKLGNAKEVTKDWLKFKYRSSRIKETTENYNSYIILDVWINLKKMDAVKLKKNLNKVISRRIARVPHGKSAGCIFKNPSKAKTAGYLIDKSGLKGQRVGDAEISGSHANFIINRDKARGDQIRKLINLARKKVLDNFSVDLKREIRILSPSGWEEE